MLLSKLSMIISSPPLHIEVPPLVNTPKKHKAGSATQTLGQGFVESVGYTSLPRCLVWGSSISSAAVGWREHHALHMRKGAKGADSFSYYESTHLGSFRAINGPI